MGFNLRYSPRSTKNNTIVVPNYINGLFIDYTDPDAVTWFDDLANLFDCMALSPRGKNPNWSFLALVTGPAVSISRVFI